MLPPVLSPKRSSSSVVLGSPSSPLPAIPSAALLTPRSAEMQEMRVLSIGICIDYFTITGLAGDGSNGVVFSATCKVPDHPFPGKPYALKAMYVYGGSTSKNTSKERFEAEFKLLARLRPHPRYTQFHSWCSVSLCPLLPYPRLHCGTLSILYSFWLDKGSCAGYIPA